MVDVFYMYAVSRGSASRFDWLNHVSCARELMLSSDSPFQPRMELAVFVRHPDSFHYGLDLYLDGENTYVAYDENNPGIMLDLTRSDIELIELPPMLFGKWLLRLLQLPTRCRIRLLCHDKLFYFQMPCGGLYVSAAASVEELREHLSAMAPEAPALCIALDDSLERFECVARMLGEADQLTYHSIHDYIALRNNAYVYTNPVPLIDIIKELSESSPEAEFLPRPAGCRWHDLHVQIHSYSHYDTLSIDNELIDAWYEDSSGKVVGSRERRKVSAWGILCRNGKATYVYSMLKLFAAHKGRMTRSQLVSINNANHVRTRLRKFLCQLFGYSEDENPIIEEVSKSRVFRTEFSISFSDANSDPLAEKRGRARVKLKD